MQAFEYAGYGSLYTVAHGFDTGFHIDDSRVVFGRGAEQSLAFDYHGVVLVDDRTEVLILQADIGRNYFVGIGRVVDIIAQEFHQTDLGLVFDAELFVLGVFFQSNFCIGSQVSQT